MVLFSVLFEYILLGNNSFQNEPETDAENNFVFKSDFVVRSGETNLTISFPRPMIPIEPFGQFRVNFGQYCCHQFGGLFMEKSVYGIFMWEFLAFQSEITV